MIAIPTIIPMTPNKEAAIIIGNRRSRIPADISKLGIMKEATAVIDTTITITLLTIPA